MCSATSSPSFLFLPTPSPTLSLPHRTSFPNPQTPFLCFLRPTVLRRNRRHLSASFDANLVHSWLSPPHSPSEDFGGWAVVESPTQRRRTKKAFPSYAVVGIGTSLAVLVALLSSLSLSKKGFKIQLKSPLLALHGIWSPVKTQDDGNTTTGFDMSKGSNLMSDETEEAVPVATTETATSAIEKPERVTVPVSVDSTQEEALTVLKTLKIIEDDVEANDLCTRRKLARWLVKLNSSLERNPKHRIAPIVSLSRSTITAFDDISVEDPDFISIQVLAEAGVVPSRLSKENSFDSNGSGGQENINFFPDRFVSRQDLIDWKAQLEYEFWSGLIDEISIKKAGYMDVKEISSPALYVDMLAGDRSILRKVYGQSKRFQPNKPSTNAQVAVALTSGRIKEAISVELARIEAENSARQAEAEEIRSELLNRGDIQRFWDEKLREERNRGTDVEKLYLDAVNNLEEESANQEKIYAEYLKEKAAMDCQKQLLVSLKNEIDEISEKLASERVAYVDEKNTVEKLLRDVESKHEEMLDTKSTLEAEKEALQILRSWVEDEARRSQARAAVLAEVGRRWKWDDQKLE